MKYQPRDIDRLSRNIMEELEEEIEKSGIFYRIFYRCKGNKSLQRKLEKTDKDGTSKYNGENKFLRDIIGIRINLYFIDDLDIVTEFFWKKLSKLFAEATIDKNKTTEFKPSRVNLIFHLPNKYKSEFREVITDKRIDATFELQLRTVLSEGWHEVEHDLRYKCQNDWEPYPEMSRVFNGFLAALETQEWSMVQLFERISYNHYKADNLSALIRTKLRIRFDDLEISNELLDILTKHPSFIRDLFKTDRISIVKFLLDNKVSFPLTIDNVIYLINYCFIKNQDIQLVTPDIISKALNELTSISATAQEQKLKEIIS